MRELLEPGGWIELVDAWDPNHLTTMAALVAELPLRQETVVIAGQRHLTPRLTSWHGDPEAVYRYSGRVFAPEPWTPALAAILARLRDEVHPGLNACLANYYRDGQDAMGAHSDDEPELGPDAPRDVIIASVSLGDVRRFALAPKKKSRRSERSRVAGRTLDADGRRRSEEEADASATRAERGLPHEERRVLELGHGSLLVMGGALQAHWRHSLPRTAKPVGPRLNLTFRIVRGGRPA